jgi:hypothetical protein
MLDSRYKCFGVGSCMSSSRGNCIFVNYTRVSICMIVVEKNNPVWEYISMELLHVCYRYFQIE